jgi:hypothetical protein
MPPLRTFITAVASRRIIEGRIKNNSVSLLKSPRVISLSYNQNKIKSNIRRSIGKPTKRLTRNGIHIVHKPLIKRYM